MSNSNLLSTAGKPIEEAALRKFEASLLGEVIRPNCERYELARRIWNGNPAQDIPAYRVQLAVAAKETDYPLGLLKGLDQCVEQDAVEAPVAEPNAVLMMLKKGVHGTPPTVVNARKVTP